ncbi:MAG: LytR C-terminal domain-containing protein [Actinomycetota bacterium]|nr:LytR C-terminal domain-containing protein [Actinomycetota bacterium]MED5277164.1 LytR C-terminal domain-containing protein [Actinomycetota bacterium]
MQSPLSGKGIAPSNASAAPRAFLLIFVAVVIGVVVLWKGLDDDLQTASSDISDSSDQVTNIVDEEPADLPPLEIPEISTTTVAVVETTTTSPPPLPTKPPSTVKVLVLNGSGVGGAAGAVTNLLKPHGYTTLSPANGNKDEKSWVYYKPEFSPDAKGVTDILDIMPDLLTSFPTNGLSVPEGSVDRVSTADVIVFLGSDKEIYG